jgi:hypothetical protein
MAYSNIDKPNQYFNTVLYTGNGSTQTITGVGFQPDLVWLKNRSNSLWWHILVDAVRGAGITLSSNVNNSEFGTGSNIIPDFDPDGFDLNVIPNATGNENSSSYVAWNWKAGGTASSNTDGSITSSVSANTTSGFSIVSYSGAGATATVGHGLGVTPDAFIIKRRTGGTEDWYFYTQKIDGSLDYLKLNTTDAAFNSGASAPTSTVFSVSSSAATGASGSTYIAYCFAEKKGFSKFGKYTGNGSATDGTFIYTGFKPAWVMTKKITDSTSANWLIQTADGLNPYNPVNQQSLRANLIDAALNAYDMDFLSNGIKMYNDSSNANETSKEFIYMAFAENPLVGSNLVPNNAR